MTIWKPKEITRNEILRRLAELNAELDNLQSHSEELALIVVGGSALLLRGQTDREATKDIDVLDAPKSLFSYLRPDDIINCDARAYGDCIPYNYEDRLEVLDLGFPKLIVGTPSLEDLVVMKLYASRENDDVDLHSERLLKDLDWERLDSLILSPDEARASILADQDYRRLVLTYREYREECGPTAPPAFDWPYSLRAQEEEHER